MEPYWNRAVGISADNSWNVVTKFTLFRITHTIMNKSCQFKKCSLSYKTSYSLPIQQNCHPSDSVFCRQFLNLASKEGNIYSSPVNSQQDKKTTVALLFN